MKNLFDMTYEEIKEVRKSVLNHIKNTDFETNTEEYVNSRMLYSYWLRHEGIELGREWIAERGGRIIDGQPKEYITYMVGKFSEWLEEE